MGILDRSIQDELGRLDNMLENILADMRAHQELLEKNNIGHWSYDVDYIRDKIRDIQRRISH